MTQNKPRLIKFASAVKISEQAKAAVAPKTIPPKQAAAILTEGDILKSVEKDGVRFFSDNQIRLLLQLRFKDGSSFFSMHDSASQFLIYDLVGILVEIGFNE